LGFLLAAIRLPRITIFLIAPYKRTRGGKMTSRPVTGLTEIGHFSAPAERGAANAKTKCSAPNEVIKSAIPCSFQITVNAHTLTINCIKAN
jgi:hypothetical protein